VPARPLAPASLRLARLCLAPLCLVSLCLVSLCLALLVPAPAVAAPKAATVPRPTVPATTWAWPLAGPPPVTRGFAPPADPFGRGHRGVDLAGAPGAPVLAAGDGVVVFAGMVAGRPVVSVDHPGGLRTTYEPVDPSVAAGRAVARGSPIGTLLAGHAGCPAGACLHWGVRRGETYLDPLNVLRPPRVRLLPWRGGPFPSRVGRRSDRRNGPRRRPQPA
jgi:murein DD-endopeptidase MepM/ murein hydrolase activator NlpD